jgi:hypothetical protein
LLEKKANKLKERKNVTLSWCTVCKNKMVIRKVLNNGNGNGNGRGRVKVFAISAVTGVALQIAVVTV